MALPAGVAGIAPEVVGQGGGEREQALGDAPRVVPEVVEGEFDGDVGDVLARLHVTAVAGFVAGRRDGGTGTEHQSHAARRAALQLLEQVPVDRDLQDVLGLGTARELRVPRLVGPRPALARDLDAAQEVGVAEPAPVRQRRLVHPRHARVHRASGRLDGARGVSAPVRPHDDGDLARRLKLREDARLVLVAEAGDQRAVPVEPGGRRVLLAATTLQVPGDSLPAAEEGREEGRGVAFGRSRHRVGIAAPANVGLDRSSLSRATVAGTAFRHERSSAAVADMGRLEDRGGKSVRQAQSPDTVGSSWAASCGYLGVVRLLSCPTIGIEGTSTDEFAQ